MYKETKNKNYFDRTKIWLNALLILCVAGGILIVLPHLTDEIWQDEAYTFFRFANKGFWYPFTDYHVPNNHVLFSAILSKWWEPGDSLIYLRSLPLAILIVSLLLTAIAAERLGGILVAILTTVMFSASNITENFALQLRGYSVSWLPVTAILLVMPLFAQYGNWYLAVIYLFAATASVAIMPTNMLICLVFMLWGLVQVMNHQEVQMRTRLYRALVIILGPFLGLIIYVPVWEQFVSHSHNYISSWSKLAVLQHWVWASLYEYAWMAPIFLLGLASLVNKARRDPAFGIGSPRNNLTLLIIAVAALPAWLAVLPSSPYPRNFVPFLPVWYFLTALIFVSGWNFCFQRKQSLGQFVFMPLAIAVFIYTVLSNPCMSFGINNEFPQDLCRQFYHEQYFPTKTVQALEILSENKPIAVLSDFEGQYSLGFVVENTAHSKFKLMHYRQWKGPLSNGGASSPPLIVTRSKNDLEKILGELGLSADKYVNITSTGYYKIFGLSALWKPAYIQ